MPKPKPHTLTSVADLRPAPYNPRTISDPAKASLMVSLKQFGDLSGLTWNVRTGHLVAGHQRLTALKAQHKDLRLEGGVLVAGEHRFPVRVVDWDEITEKAANVAANSPLLSGTFTDGLDAILKEVAEAMPDLSAALQLPDLADLVERAKVVVTEDEVPLPPKRAFSKPGDLWLLGDHRILCGDATKPEDVARVMDGKRADMVFTDPPYALFGNSTGIAGVADDKMIAPFFRDVFRACVDAVATFGHIYVCCDWHSAHVLRTQAISAGLVPKNLCVWDKGDGGIGAMYQNCHELVWFFGNTPPGKSTAGSKRTGERTVNGKPNIWRHKRADNELHNAAKPVDMIANAVRNSSDETVLDLFLGSGTTLIAAEQLGRKCYGLEIEPRYVDVIVQRFFNLVGTEPRLLRAGKEIPWSKASAGFTARGATPKTEKSKSAGES